MLYCFFISFFLHVHILELIISKLLSLVLHFFSVLFISKQLPMQKRTDGEGEEMESLSVRIPNALSDI